MVQSDEGVSMDLEIRAHEILNNIEYVNIATISKDGDPWNTPVYARFDESLNMYWSSWIDAEHSKNVRDNGKVFCTIYDSKRRRGDNNRRCLYLKGRSIEVGDVNEVDKAISLLYPEEGEKSESFLGEGLRRIYSAVLSEAWLNDKSERQVTRDTVKMRVPISLELLKSLN